MAAAVDAARELVEDSLVLDVAVLRRQGWLRQGEAVGPRPLPLDEAGENAISLEADLRSLGWTVLTLRYGWTWPGGGSGVEHCRIWLTPTLPRFARDLSGCRWWLRCPAILGAGGFCRRARKLYLPPGRRVFGCRTCHGLTYACRQAARSGTPRVRLAAPPP
jgi:hypothetical protein